MTVPVFVAWTGVPVVTRKSRPVCWLFFTPLNTRADPNTPEFGLRRRLKTPDPAGSGNVVAECLFLCGLVFLDAGQRFFGRFHEFRRNFDRVEG